MTLVSRSERQFQRYKSGCRQVVGCIPYRFKNCTEDENEELEVLVISSQNRKKGMLFPKGGWESGESMEEGALRETMEEAGVSGYVQFKLGDWRFKSGRHGTFNEGYMFSLLVKDQLDSWPEKNVRTRAWMTVGEAKEACQHGWMKEALDELVRRLAPSLEL